MCLTPEQEAAIHEWKKEIGIDGKIGDAIASAIGIPAGNENFEAIAAENFNPVLKDVIREFCPNRKK